MSSRPAERVPGLYWLFAALVVLVALAGYAGYVLYPRFDLPAATGLGLLALAAGAGFASFFSPCSFPLLVTMLGREVQTAERGGRLRRAASFALALALGASAFLALLGLGLAAGGDALFEEVTFTSTAGRIIRLVVGGALILLGLVQLNVLSAPIFGAIEELASPLRRSQARLRRRRPFLGFALFGFGYLLAGFG